MRIQYRHLTLALFGCVWLYASVGAAKQVSPSDKRPVLALLTVQGDAGFSDAQVRSVEELLLGALDQTGRFHVIGESDLRTMLDLEAKKQAAGCGDDTGCMTEIAGALGADYVSTAHVGRLGTATLLTFKVIQVRTATVLVHATRTVDRDEQLVPAADAIAAAAVAAVFNRGDVLAKAAPAVDVQPAAPPAPAKATPAVKPLPKAAMQPPPRRSRWRIAGITGLSAGAAVLAVATVLAITVKLDTNTLRQTTQPGESIKSVVDNVNSRAIAADVLFGVGGVGSAGGLGVMVAF